MQRMIEKYKRKMLLLLLKLRAPLVRLLIPKSSYILLETPFEPSAQPLSRSFGFDRGTAIDRYYAENFLSSCANDIKGHCLEIDNSDYIEKFGGKKVTKTDVLDINTKNKLATIYGDLRNLDNINDNTYDCVITTQVFGMIDDFHTALSECYRILKPGGVLIGTATCFGPMSNPKYSYWRFTPTGMNYALTRHFPAKNITIHPYGNALAGQASWVGMAAEELDANQLDLQDTHFPVLVGFRAQK